MRVSTESVIEGIRQHGRFDDFTTHDIALTMGVEEYPVRTAFSWLRRYRIIELHPEPAERQTKATRDAYTANRYRVLDHSAVQAQTSGVKSGLDALYQVFYGISIGPART